MITFMHIITELYVGKHSMLYIYITCEFLNVLVYSYVDYITKRECKFT